MKRRKEFQDRQFSHTLKVIEKKTKEMQDRQKQLRIKEPKILEAIRKHKVNIESKQKTLTKIDEENRRLEEQLRSFKKPRIQSFIVDYLFAGSVVSPPMKRPSPIQRKSRPKHRHRQPLQSSTDTSTSFAPPPGSKTPLF